VNEQAVEDAERIRRRYPKRRAGRFALIVVSAVLALTGLAWVGWAAWDASHPAVAGQVAGFTVTSDTAVTVALIVERPDPSRAAVCDVYVQAESYERVGELSVKVPPSSAQQVRFDVVVKTFKRGTSASLGDCRPS
jgi:hypothetical protein